ncbi:MAG: hypothetical protein ACE5FO_04110 [Parvularculaceae bacterium]
MSTQQTLNEILDRLLDVLEREKKLLLEGDYLELPALAAEKDESVNALDRLLVEPGNIKQLPVYKKRFAKVTALSQENENLLNSARAGVESAQARIKDVINRHRSVGVYGQDGDKPLVPDAGVTRWKMA